MKLKLSDTVDMMLSKNDNDLLYVEYWQARIRRDELHTKVFMLENAVRNEPSEKNFRKLKLAYRKMQLLSDYTSVLMDECVLCGIRDLTDAPMLEKKAAKQENESGKTGRRNKMSNITKKFYQRCDFCKKEYELIKADLSEQPYMLDSISLPGYATSMEAPRTRAIVCGSICDSCMDRLRKILEPYLRLENAEYCGKIIEWKEEKPE